MTSKVGSPKFFSFALILVLLVLIPLSTTVFARRHRGGGGRGRHARAGGRSSRHGRLARGSRRGRLSRREVRAARARVAREQASAVNALERRLHRPLTKKERAAEMRRVEGRHRRELELARRRAEAARRAAIARARALDKAQRDEAQGFIAHDDVRGEDLEVRRVAINALGNHAGTVVVMDPKTGRIYSIVNQEWGVRRGFKPCSTIKLVTGLAGLNEKVINPTDTTNVSISSHLDLTEALAHSNNTYFQQVGGQVGFDKMMAYSRELGLGEKTGINSPNEYPGRLPFLKSGYALNRMSSHGDDYEVTAVQLASLVSAMANGGNLLAPRIPSSTKDDVKPKVRRQLNIQPDSFQRMVPGMVGAVNYGTGKLAYDPTQTVVGKTGTCIQDGNWVGLFASYAPLVNPKLAVVVIARRTDGRGHFPVAVAGQIYRDLNRRFGTPTFIPIAASSDAADQKADADVNNEEQKDIRDQEQKEQQAPEVDISLMPGTETKATAKQNSGNVTPANNKVKPVMMQIPKKGADTTKPAPSSKTPPPVQSGEERPRRINDQP